LGSVKVYFDGGGSFEGSFFTRSRPTISSLQTFWSVSNTMRKSPSSAYRTLSLTISLQLRGRPFPIACVSNPPVTPPVIDLRVGRAAHTRRDLPTMPVFQDHALLPLDCSFWLLRSERACGRDEQNQCENSGLHGPSPIRLLGL
jgi:hypothetical protein